VEARHQDTTLLASMMVVGLVLLGCKAIIKDNGFREVDRVKQSKCCRRNVGRLRNGRGSCVTITKSSSTIEVSYLFKLFHLRQLIVCEAVSGVKSDRSMSPNTMSDEDRRELIARQHRALYGDNSSLYGSDGSSQRPPSQDVRVSGSGRGPSPLAYDPYGVQSQSGSEGAVQMPPRDRGNSTASPVSNQTTQHSYTLLSDAQQSSRTSNSSPDGEPQKGGVPGVAPIGTRPMQAPNSAGGMNKRSTTPLTPSTLSQGFSADSQNTSASKDERSTSAASNPALADKGVSGLGSWGTNSGVWGSGKNLAVQPSVWG
jgi:hypothetical protein